MAGIENAVAAAIIGTGDGRTTQPCVVDRAGQVNCPAGPVPGISDAIAREVGPAHSCAIRRGGGVACWGSRSSGKLGDGSSDVQPRPVQVPGLSDAVVVVTAFERTCVVHRAGGVSCWSASGPPKLIEGVTRATDLGLGIGSACALQKTGRVLCWGWGEDGDRTTRPTRVRGVRGAREISVSADGLACAVRRSGAVLCWEWLGPDADEEPGAEERYVSRPARVRRLRGVAQLEAGRVARTTGGRVLFIPGREEEDEGEGAPTPVPGAARAAHIAASDYDEEAYNFFLAFRDRAGRVSHALVYGTEEDEEDIEWETVPIEDAVEISTAAGLVCATRSAGPLTCWAGADGADNPARLGDGTLELEDERRAELGELPDAISVSVSDESVCAVRQSGEVFCWGATARLGLNIPAIQRSAVTDSGFP